MLLLSRYLVISLSRYLGVMRCVGQPSILSASVHSLSYCHQMMTMFLRALCWPKLDWLAYQALNRAQPLKACFNQIAPMGFGPFLCSRALLPANHRAVSRRATGLDVHC